MDKHPYIEMPPWEKRYLVRGRRYRVIKSFIDADGAAHPIGEEWRFIESEFSRFDNIYFLHVELASGTNKVFTLRSNADTQQSEVASHFDEYVMST